MTDSSTCCNEALPVSSEVLQVTHKVLQKAGFSGDKEVKKDAVVKGDALKQKQEVAVRVAARGTGSFQRSKFIQPRTLSAKRDKQFS